MFWALAVFPWVLFRPPRPIIFPLPLASFSLEILFREHRASLLAGSFAVSPTHCFSLNLSSTAIDRHDDATMSISLVGMKFRLRCCATPSYSTLTNKDVIIIDAIIPMLHFYRSAVQFYIGRRLPSARFQSADGFAGRRRGRLFCHAEVTYFPAYGRDTQIPWHYWIFASHDDEISADTLIIAKISYRAYGIFHIYRHRPIFIWMGISSDTTGISLWGAIDEGIDGCCLRLIDSGIDDAWLIQGSHENSTLLRHAIDDLILMPLVMMIEHFLLYWAQAWLISWSAYWRRTERHAAKASQCLHTLNLFSPHAWHYVLLHAYQDAMMIDKRGLITKMF